MKKCPKAMEKGSDPPPSYFPEKIHSFGTQKKCPKAMDWPRPPPPPYGKMPLPSNIFHLKSSLNSPVHYTEWYSVSTVYSLN